MYALRNLPAPRAELALTVAGAVAGASVKRPAHVPVDVEIDGGAHELSLDGVRLAAIAGVVRQRTKGGREGGRGDRFESAGAARQLTVAANERLAADAATVIVPAGRGLSGPSPGVATHAHGQTAEVAPWVETMRRTRSCVNSWPSGCT